MTIIKYTNTQFRGECNVEEGFVPYLDKMNASAKRYGIIIIVKSSERLDLHVPGAIVKPATHGDHLVAHAIDVNLEQNGVLHNSTSLYHPSGEIRQFIDECKSFGMRWGGDFHDADPVHFDDDIYHRDPVKWQELYNEIHNVKSN